MTSPKLTLGTAGALCLSIACSRGQPLSIGAKGAPCTAGGACDPGLICVAGVCTDLPDSASFPAEGNAGGGTGGSAGAGGLAVLGGAPGLGGVVASGGTPNSGGTAGSGGTGLKGGPVGSGGLG